MAITNKETLKGYFKAGAIPTEANFSDLVDSVLSENGNDLLFIDNVNGRTGIGTNTPQKTLDINGSFRISKTENASDANEIFFQDNGQIRSLDNNHRIIFNRTDDKMEFREKGDIIFSTGVTDGNKNPRLLIDRNGNVGIGTDKPLKRLDIAGGVRISKTDDISEANEILFQDNGQIRSYDNSHRIIFDRTNDKMEFREKGDIIFSTGVTDGNKNTRLLIDRNGNVGIGTDKPLKRLDIAGGVRINKTDNISDANEILFQDNGQIRSLDDNHRIIFDRINNTMEFREYGEIIFSTGVQEGKKNPKLLIDRNGNVGIGAATPTKGKLEVTGYNEAKVDLLGFYAHAKNPPSAPNDKNWGTGSHQGANWNKDVYCSIWASNAIVCSGLYVTSDARIKNLIPEPAENNVLNTISKLKVYNYHFVDFVSHGAQQQKGFLAQEVEKVFPEAVSMHSDFVPDIFSMSANSELSDGLLTLTLDKPHGLEPGDRVRLVTNSLTTEQPITVTGSNTFTVANWNYGEGNVFVYGKEVNDFRTIDYNKIFCLNVSATQQLARQIESLVLENEQMKSEINNLKTFFAVSKN